MTRHALALVGAIGVSIALPRLVLPRHETTTPALPHDDGKALVPAQAASIDALLDRPLFGTDTVATAVEAPGDADAPPRIAGIAGRLPDQAVVLVRETKGRTRTLSIGDSAGRWRLVSIGADAALFTNGARRARVELPADDGPQ